MEEVMVEKEGGGGLEEEKQEDFEEVKVVVE